MFIRLWKVLDKYDPQFAFSTWLYRIVMNLAIDHVRRETRHRHGAELDLSRVEGRDGGPDRLLSTSELQRVFLALADELPPKQRSVFVLRELEELPTDEVAAILKVSTSTVRNHLFQARKTLRVALARRFPEYVPLRLRSAKDES